MSNRNHPPAPTAVAPVIPARIKVWDLPTRLFHWGLVVLIVLLFVSGEFGGLDVPLPGGGVMQNMDFHMLLGQLALSLVLYRLLWGLVGSSTARFAAFVRGPGAVLAYLAAVRRGEHPLYAGHNPAGALMIVALLAVLLVQAGTGLFANDDILSEGPLAALVGKDLSDTLTGIHGLSVKALLLLVVIHVGAVVVYRLKGDNLVSPMITGDKPADRVPADDVPRMAPALLALLLFALSCVVVFTGVRLV